MGSAHWSMLMFRACLGPTQPRASSCNTWSESLQAATFCDSWKALSVQCTVNRVHDPRNLAVNLKGQGSRKVDGPLSRNKIESGRLPTQRERIIAQCAKVAPNLPESGITHRFLVSPEHHPSAAVHPPISVDAERSPPSHCNEFRQRSSPYADRRRAWCSATLEEPRPIRGSFCQARVLPVDAMQRLMNNSIVALVLTAVELHCRSALWTQRCCTGW